MNATKASAVIAERKGMLFATVTLYLDLDDVRWYAEHLPANDTECTFYRELFNRMMAYPHDPR